MSKNASSSRRLTTHSWFLLFFALLSFATLLSSADAQSLSAWLGSHSLTDGDELTDHDEDGWPALLEYLVDSDPTDSNGRLSVSSEVVSGNRLALNMRSSRSAVPSDLTVQLQGSNSLETASWNDAAFGSQINDNGDGSWTYVYTQNTALDSGGYPFLRLSVTSIDPPDPVAPTITGFSNQTVTEGDSAFSLNFTVADTDTPVDSLTTTVASDNTSLFPLSALSITGTGANRSLQITPPSSGTGTAQITVTVSDGALSASSAFLITVNSSGGGTADGYDIILVWGQSNERGKEEALDPALDADPTGRIQQFALSGKDADGNSIIGTIVDVDDGQLYTPIAPSQAVGPGFAFAKAYADQIAANRKVLIVPCMVGGTSFIGNPRWNPDGIDNGDQDGDLYFLAISGCNDAVVAAQALYPDSRIVGFYGGPGENDAGYGSYAEFLDKYTRAIQGFRDNITGASTAWAIKSGMLPEWALTGATSRYALDAAQMRAEEVLPYYAFADGVEGYAYDNIHYTAEGNRIKGAQAAALVPIAKSRTTAVPFPTDLYSGTAGGDSTSVRTPELACSMRRVVKGYTGPAIRLRNAATGIEQDIDFQSNGELDYFAVEAFANGEDCYLVRFYDQSGNSRDLVAPDDVSEAQFVLGGTPMFLGRRPAVGRGKAAYYECTEGFDSPSFASVIGNFPAGNNRIAMQSGTIIIGRSGSGTLTMEPGSQELESDIGEEYLSISVDASSEQMWVNGQLADTQNGTAMSFTSSGSVSFMATSGSTRNVRGDFTEMVLFSGSLSQGEIDIINQGLRAYSAWNSYESDAAQ